MTRVNTSFPAERQEGTSPLSKEAKPKLKVLFSGVLGECFYETWDKKHRTEHEEKLSKEVSQLETSFLQ